MTQQFFKMALLFSVALRQKINLLALVSIVALPLSTFADNVLSPQQDRIGDNIIYRDHGVYRDTQQRIKKLNDGGIRVADYHLSKAQCWLDVSFHEYTRNDRSNFPPEALSESQRILSALENRQNPGQETPLVNGAEKLRLDLWARYDALKQHAGYQCATQQTACAEVELVHAGNEIKEAGWRHAKPYIQIAEDLTGVAEKSAASCLPAAIAPIVPTAPAAPAALPVSATELALAPAEKIVLSADALFQFDKSGSKNLLAKGRAELDDLAQKINTGKTGVTSLTVIGHTDRLGSVAYNLRLSQARAKTVKTYLEQLGVSLPITIEGRGMQDQVVSCKNIKLDTALRDCLQINRRVEVVVHRAGNAD